MRSLFHHRKITAIVFVSVLIALAPIGWRAGRYLCWCHAAQLRVDAEIARLKAAGEPLTASELHAIHRVPDGAVDLTAKWLEALSRFDAAGPDEHEYQNLPLIGLKTLDDLELTDDECLSKTVEFLRRIEPQIDGLMALLREDGDVRFPVDFEHHLAAKLPHLPQLRSVANVLVIRSRVCAMKGNTEELDRSLWALSALPHTLDHARTMVEQMMRCVLSRAACDAILDTANRGQLSADELHRFARQLDEIDFKRAAWLAYTGERVMTWEALNANASLLTGDTSATTSWIRNAGPVDRAFILEALARTVTACQADFSEASLEFELLDQQLKKKMSLPGLERMHYLYSAILLPMNYGAYVAFVNQDARRRVTAAALLAHDFRLREGHWPVNMTELAGDDVSSAIVDPFTGEPLHLQTRESDLVIYSVGKDLADDGGRELNARFEPDIVAVAKAVP